MFLLFSTKKKQDKKQLCRNKKNNYKVLKIDAKNV